MLRSLLRVALTLVVLAGSLATIAPVTAADDGGTFHPAWTVFDGDGSWGPYYDYDTSDLPGVECWNAGNTVDISLAGVSLYSYSSYSSETVSVQWYLFKVLANGSSSLVSQSSVHYRTAYYSTPANFPYYTFYDRPLGPTYIGVARLIWYNSVGNAIGFNDALYDYYSTYVDGGYYGVKDACYSPYHPTASLSPTSGTVNSSVSFSTNSFPANSSLTVKWDSTTLGSISSNSSGKSSGSFKVPAAPLGKHTVRWSTGGLAAQRTFTVIPRIKITPSVNVRRGQIVNVSLRGYAAHETVNIRWKKGSTWAHVAYVTTSSTGSANIDVRVPNYVPDGSTSVRGDGSYGRAQTNAVTVSGGTFRSSEATKTPTSTPSPNVSPTSTATAAPTQSPEASPTIEPTTPANTPEASPTASPTEPPSTDTPTTEPSESATPPDEASVEPTATTESNSVPPDDATATPDSQ